MTKVSIITPTFNMGHHIEKCILSVKNQTHGNIEHIVVDNCSTDATPRLVAQYEPQYCLKYLREPDFGQADAINKGLKMATGDIVGWLNADDQYADRYSIEKIVCAFDQNPEADVVTAKGYYVNPDGTVLSPIQTINLSLLSNSDPILQPSTFWRRNTVLLEPNFHFVFDWIFFLTLYREGSRFLILDEFISLYQVDGKNKTALDTASRRWEIVQVHLRYNGAFRLNTAWCFFIFLIYKGLEMLRLSFFKKGVRFLNTRMYHLTKGKIYST